MSTAFTKTYLTELIDTRLAELAQPDGQLTGDERLLQQYYRENVLAAARAVAESARRGLLALNDALEAYDQNTDPNAYGDVQRAANQLAGIPQHRNEVHGYREVSELEERVRKARGRGAGPNPAHEIKRLQNVKKYVTDSPADEFSLTLMRSLGFLDVIKFAINA